MPCPYSRCHTAVHYGEYSTVAHDKENNVQYVKRSGSISDLDPHKQLSDPSWSQRFSQDLLTPEYLLHNHTVLSQISEGGFGAVYHFMLDNKAMVLKISVEMLKDYLVTVNGSVL